MHALFFLPLAALFALASASALPHAVSRRGSPASSYPVTVSRSNASEGFGFSHERNEIYTATITVNGAEFQVLLDGGSSDTWLDPSTLGGATPPGLIETGANISTTYVDGNSLSGPIVLANVTFGPYTVNNQAISLSTGNGSVAAAGSFNGLIGLAGSPISETFITLENTSFAENGKPIIYNLFSHEPDLPSYMTWLMSRSYTGIADGGVLTISEVLSNMTAILSATQIDSVLPGKWTTFLSGVTVNGRTITGSSNASISELYKHVLNVTVPDGETVATFDTGTTSMEGPVSFVDEIYKDVAGAQRNEENGTVTYSVPCDTAMNISWTFSNNETFPMHPIDTTVLNVTDSGDVSCQGSISGTSNPLEDWILGDAFMRSFYILFNYGDVSAAFARAVIQLLSIIDADTAWAETSALLEARLAAVKADYTSTVSQTPPTGLPVFTGTKPDVTLTSAPDSIVTPSPGTVASGSSLVPAMSTTATATM